MRERESVSHGLILPQSPLPSSLLSRSEAHARVPGMFLEQVASVLNPGPGFKPQTAAWDLAPLTTRHSGPSSSFGWGEEWRSG